jgi:uncharacterized membrane protein YfcA
VRMLLHRRFCRRQDSCLDFLENYWAVVASDIAHAVPLTLVAGAGHRLIGTVDWHIVGWLLAGSLPGIALGSCLVVRVPETALRLLLAAPLVVVAGKLAYDHIESGSTLVVAFTRQAPH